VRPSEMAELLRRGSTNTEAYEAFLKGRAEFIGHLAEADLKSTSKASAFFERAVHLDPGFPDGWAWLAFAKQTQFAKGGDRSLLRDAVADAHRALSIDPDSIAARLALINVYHSTGQAEEGLRLAAQSLKISPHDPEAMLAAAKAYFRGAKGQLAGALFLGVRCKRRTHLYVLLFPRRSEFVCGFRLSGLRGGHGVRRSCRAFWEAYPRFPVGFSVVSVFNLNSAVSHVATPTI